ncbi:MAG: DUF1801 domain-containing protein [Pseudomonadota bacterium]
MTEALFKKLKALFRPYAKDMIVKTDTPTNFYLEETQSADKPTMFGAVQIKKNYISVHLMPVYCHPELLDDIPDELRKRMQGKSCFNFKKPDDVPWDALKALVASSYSALKA